MPVEWADARGEPFDTVGALLYAFGLTALMYGFSCLPEMRGAGFIAAGGAGLVLFAAWEVRTAYPILNIRIFRSNRTFAFSNLAALINYSATFAVSFLLSLYLQYINGFTPVQAGVVLVATPVIQALLSPLAGRLSDRIAPRLLASGGMAATVVSLVMFTRLDATSTLPYILTGLVILGGGFAFFSSPNMNAIMSAVDRSLYGVASGVSGAMRLIGQMMSMGIAMIAFAMTMGCTRLSPDCYPLFLRALTIIFAILSVLCTAGVFASLARGPRARTDAAAGP
jgi:predicted MFS family arabinose efflux permease